MAGKAVAQILIEILLLIVSALLSAGAATAARAGMLLACFASAGVKVATSNRKIRRAKVAFESVGQMVNDLARAGGQLHCVGVNLLEARAKPFVARAHQVDNSC